jgi:hypothetical protein
MKAAFAAFFIAAEFTCSSYLAHGQTYRRRH